MFTPEEQSYLVVADIEPVKAFLTTALNSQISGDKAQYELIVHQLRLRDDPETLWKVLVGLCNFSYILTKQAEEFRRLLNCIFSYDWKCEQKVSIAVVNLINHLVTTNSTFLARAFQLYVKSLLPGMTTSLASETVEENLPQRRNLIHRALRGILVQVPTGRSVLYPILCEHFPHKRFSRAVQTDYTAQLLHICTYEPMLQAKVLELIIMKCLEMDVEIVIEDSGDVRIDEQALDDGDLDLDDDLEFDGIAGSSGNRYNTFNHGNRGAGKGYGNNIGPGGRRKQLTDTAPTRIPAEVAEMADKLDSVLLLLVQFCEQQIGDTGASSSAVAVLPTSTVTGSHPPVVASSGTRDRVLQQLLTIFEANIMSIHKSKFVQFIVFFAASLHAPFARAVAEKLLSITLDDRASGTQRQSAVMYLASYLSRAAFLQADFVSDVVSRLLSWAAAYASRSGGISSGFAGLSPVPSMQSLPRAHSSGTLRASTSGASLSDRTSREASLENSLSSPGRRAATPATSTNSIYAAENVEFDEFGRAFVREVTVSRHELFYSVVQAACYTLCFYGVGMAARQRDDSAVRACWEAVVTCKFDPLRYCLKTVRIEFIRLAAAVGLFSSQCWDCIPADLLYTELLMQQQVQQTTVKASRASDNATMTTFTTTEATTVYSSARAGGHGMVQSQGVVMGGGSRTEVQSANTLDSFFPFDPCLLCKLHKTVENAYRSWDGVPGLDDVPDDELYEEEDEDDYDFEEEESVGIAAGGGKGLAGKSSSAIPVQQQQHRRSSEGRRGVAYTPGSAMSEGGDAFATSSLSSVVSSIACTDTAMSVVSSMHMSSQSPFAAGSYLRAAQASMLETSGSAGRSALREDDGDDDSDDGMHDPHMSAPSSGIKTGGGSGAGAERFDSNYRRPRFYSVGSTGSW